MSIKIDHRRRKRESTIFKSTLGKRETGSSPADGGGLGDVAVVGGEVELHSLGEDDPEDEGPEDHEEKGGCETGLGALPQHRGVRALDEGEQGKACKT